MKNFSGTAKKGAAKILRKAAAWAILAGCGFALVRCEDRVAGSSVTTGNPTEIQVGFTGENGPVAISGRVDIYGATQIPISGFRPEALAHIDLAGNSEFLLTPSHLESIADSLWPLGSKDGDSLVHFNLVVIGDKQGAILRGMAYRTKDSKFAMKDGSWKAGVGGKAMVSADVSALVEYRSIISSKNLDSSRLNYLFLKGTGFAAKSDSGLFVFSAVPSGTHSVSFLTLPGGHNTDLEDSADVYGVNKPMVAGQVDTLLAADLDLRLPMPDEYNKP